MEKSCGVTATFSTAALPPALDGVEGARADERQPRRARPAHVDEDGVAERGPFRDECAPVEREVRQVPVEAGIEPGGQSGCDIGREHGGGEEHVLGAGLGDDGLERVDARLRQRRLEGGIVDDVDRGGAVRARGGGDARDAVPTTTPATSPPSAAARESTPSEPFWIAPSWCSRKTSVVTESFLPASQSTSFSAAEPSSSILTWSPFAGGGCSASTSVREPASGPLRLGADLGQRQRLGRLRLRAHDPLQRRVARLVDRVRDRHDRRQRRRDHVVAELGLALARDRPPSTVELCDLRDQRPAKPVGDGGPEDGAVGVARLLAEEDEIGLLALERLREHVARRHEVGARGRIVGDEQRPVGPHRERLAQRVDGLRGPDEATTTSPSLRLLDPERLLDGVTSVALSAPSPERSSRLVAGSMRRTEVASGTCFTQTTIFTAKSLAGVALASRHKRGRVHGLW